MTLPCSECAKSLHIRVDLSSAELSDLYGRLRLEFGPFVMDSRRADELKKTLALADKDIEDHDSEVDRLQTQIVFVQGEKKRLETQRAKLRSLLSPVRKLPNETLLHILQYVCQENVLQSSTLGLWIHPPTMAISSVCSRWRELALMSPGLWANLTVEMNTVARARGETCLTSFVDAVTRYLARSGDWPLRLALIIRGPSHRPAVMPLMQQAHRWQTFRFWGIELTDYNLFSQSHFPLLEELDLDLGITSSDLDLFEHCPRLRAHIISRPVGPTSKVFCNQLEHLTFRRQSLVVLAEAVHACPSLKSLEIGHTTDTDLEDVKLGIWRNITSLTLKDGRSINFLLSSLTLPSLNTLVIDGTGHSDWQANLFTSFISRASCTITAFTVCGISMSDSDLIAALHLMPSLLYLKIGEFSSSYDPFTPRPSLIASLTHSQSTCALVPKLHSLILKIKYDTAIDDAAFIRMVQSRWFKPGSDLCAEMSMMGRACIRSIVVKNRKLDAEIYEPLRVLDAEGLRVVVLGINGMLVV